MGQPSIVRAALCVFALLLAGCSQREVAASEDSRLPVEPAGEWRLEQRPFLIETRATISEESRRIEQARDLCVGPHDFAYVADAATRTIWKFDAHGHPAFVFSVNGKPGALTVDLGGAIYVVDENSAAVQVLQPDGGLIRVLRGGPARRFVDPAGVAVDGYGNIFVVERGAHRVQKFNSRGRFVTAWGRRGAQPGDFDSPNGIAISFDGYLYVADAGNHRVQKFTTNGEPVAWFGSAGNGPAQFGEMSGIAVTESHVAIADSANRRVQLWSPLGVHRYDLMLSSPAPVLTASAVPSAAAPEEKPARHAVALSARRELLVLDAGGEHPRILRFRLNLD